DMVILNALKIMNNKDLDYFCLLYEHFSNKEVPEYTSLRVHDLKEEFNSLAVPIFECENTIEKLKGVQVIGYDAGGLGGVGNAWGSFKFNENSHYL
ncbi:hypothetical protein V7068_21855, partial [Bacillus sp. JJ634]